MTAPTPPGLLILHGNRLELLAEAVLAWLGRHPLRPLEEEVILVQSNGMAEWLKMQIASAHGICAATRVELPARFIWRAYRAVLGSTAVPRLSALDKAPLTWRLMRLLPELASQPGFEPVAAFLGEQADTAGASTRRLQLAQRLADLLDQYQVYRSDWLRDWGQGEDRLHNARTPEGADAPAVPPDQLWQPALWRALLQALAPQAREAARPQLHQSFLHALQQRAPAAAPLLPGLPRRVVLFGITHIPHQTLEAVAALGSHCQVLMAVPNPCRYHWADIIEGRELLRAQRRRHAARSGQAVPAPSALPPLHQMHQHGHPLLAAWGRQARDFVRQLDQFDDVHAAQQRFNVPRVDLFDEGPGRTLLEQVQAALRDLVPLHEQQAAVQANGAVPAADRSIVFQLAHGAHREVEILHDQLLELFAKAPATRPLNPRDVVVMVPDIDSFAPAIRAVFGQYARGHARHIPWGIADQKERGLQPLLIALEWLLRAPQQRFGASEVQALLDVGSVARRLRIDTDDLPTLVAWMEGAGVRWGLNAEQRGSLGLAAGGEQNTWAFGLQRMLLGYATGALEAAEGFAGIEPYAEIAGLSAGMAGALAELLQALTAWWREGQRSRTPAHWAERLRGLLAAFFEAQDDTDRALLAALDEALTSWMSACELAGFDDEVDLSVAREAWLAALDDPSAGRRFKAGGVTFCTLLPLRAIPFEVVCLLGMNDGDYPRRSARSDFDLMALPGQARPGDRSRRDDDRQLMLDALLSARRVLYVSWAGHSARDNQAQPPSVLVSQLRDHLAAVWGPDLLPALTTVHPLQAFSRRYFEPQADKPPAERLFTYASEWRAAHEQALHSGVSANQPAAAFAGAGTAPVAMTLTLAGLADFVRAPVKAFFKRRLQVAFDGLDEPTQDDELFNADGLERWSLLEEVLSASRRQLDGAVAGPHDTAAGDVAAVVQQQLARLKRAGRLPAARLGQRLEAELGQALLPMVARWQAARDAHPVPRDKQALRWVHPQHAQLVFDDWLVGLRAADATGPALWIELVASKVADAGGKSGPTLREDKLVGAWLRCVVSAACGHPAAGIVIGEGAAVHVSPPGQDEAAEVLAGLLLTCQAGLTGDRPLPTAVRTGLAFLVSPARAAEVYDGNDFGKVPGEGREACLARLYPDFATLRAQADFELATQALYAAYRQWLGAQVSVEVLVAVDATAEADTDAQAEAPPGAGAGDG